MFDEEPRTLGATSRLTATVTVQNTGARAGRETVLWSLTDVEATITQPRKRLIGFEKIDLAPGASKVVRLRIVPSRDLSYADADGRRILEPGQVLLRVGADEPVEFVLK